MGLGGISLWQLGAILLIVVLIFGTKRLRSLGTDLGGGLKSFRKAMQEGESEDPAKLTEDDSESSETSETHRDRVDS